MSPLNLPPELCGYLSKGSVPIVIGTCIDIVSERRRYHVLFGINRHWTPPPPPSFFSLSGQIRKWSQNVIHAMGMSLSICLLAWLVESARQAASIICCISCFAGVGGHQQRGQRLCELT